MLAEGENTASSAPVGGAISVVKSDTCLASAGVADLVALPLEWKIITSHMEVELI